MSAPTIFAVDQTDILLPVARKYSSRILKNGFKPILTEIADDIRKVWCKHQWLPLTFLSRMPNVIDYWEPGWNKSFDKGVAIAMSYRNLVHQGLTETLQIIESWDRGVDDGDVWGEVLVINWQNRYDQVSLVYDIA